jgi:predicted RecB family nuclease
MTTTSLHLTKTKFCTGLQCHKLLYWTVHDRKAPELVPGPAQSYIFAVGHRVGELATTYFPGGVLISATASQKKKAVADTAAAMAAGAPAIYEAAFESEGIHVRVDILERSAGDSWRIVEVKSSTKVKEQHIPDMAVQRFVLESAGVTIDRVELMHLNRECRFPDLSDLFTRSDCTAKVEAFLPTVAPLAKEMSAMLKGALPEIAIGPHCSQPYECPFSARCWPEPIAHNVGELYRGQKKQRDQLAAAGVATIDLIPPEFPLNVIQQRQVRAVCDEAPVVTDALPGQLALPSYPIHYLDFETFSPAIPRYRDTGPFHQTAVQFSCHTRHEDERLDHHEFLSEADDPRAEIAGHLLDALGTSGTIVVYSGFEATCIRDLASAVPERRDELTQLLPRLWDLCGVIREGIYHPDFHGSFSIKSTYPALCPGSGYADLEVAAGYDAMAQYDKLLQEKTPRWLKGKIRAELLAYCERDTRAMVEIHKVLEELVKAS